MQYFICSESWSWTVEEARETFGDTIVDDLLNDKEVEGLYVTQNLNPDPDDEED